MLQMYRIQDINLEDVDLKNRYYDYFLKGDITNARRIIEKNPKLNAKVLSADSLNKIVESVLYLEDIYYEEVEEFLETLKINIDLSVDELIYMTEYNNTVQYEKNNFVMYEKEIYFCLKKPPIGTDPLDYVYWLYLGLRGATSHKPLGVTYNGRWTMNKTYKKFDMVVYENRIYVAKKDNYNFIPSENEEVWFLAMTKHPQGIYVSCGGAQGTTHGDLWLYISEELKLTKKGRFYINQSKINVDLGDYLIQADGFYSTKSYSVYISEVEPKASDLPKNTIWIQVKGFNLKETSLYIAPYYPSIFEEGTIWVELIKE